MEDLQYRKLKKAILKLREENESLKEQVSELIKKGETSNAKKEKDELDEWFDFRDSSEDEE